MEIPVLRSPEVDHYVECFPPQVQEIMENIRKMVRDILPEAEEGMRYGIPTIIWHGNLFHFGAFKTHVGLYPAPREVPEFAEELAAFKGGKGTIQFPLDKPVPDDLIERIIRYRIKHQGLKPSKRKRA